jgi:hypothetical protein
MHMHYCPNAKIVPLSLDKAVCSLCYVVKGSSLTFCLLHAKEAKHSKYVRV